MKKILFISVVIVALAAGYSIAQMGGGMMSGQQGQEGQGGMMGGNMMGGGMMGSGMMGGGMMGSGMMGGGGMMDMMKRCQQAANTYQKGSGMGYDAEKYQKFLDDTTKLRKELHENQFEYSEAMRNPDTNQETISKVEQKIQELQKKLYEKAPR